MSKTLDRHPLIAEVETGGWGGEKKYFVHTIPGYWFADYETGSKSFDTVKEVLAARIEKRPE